MKLPIVDQPAFDAIECNRCGQCCEKLHLNTPSGSEGDLWWNYEGPLGWLELWCYREARGEVISPSYGIQGFEDKNFAAMLWFGQLNPMRREAEDEWEYTFSCGYLQRELDGQGTCTIHDRRPSICSRFPYGKPIVVDEWPGCSWRVEVVDFEVVQ